MTDYTLNDALMAAFAAFEGTSNDKQMAFFASTFPDSDGSTLDDYWRQWAEAYGVTGGTTQENMCVVMRAVTGDSVGTFNDVQRQFWITLIPP